MATTPDGPTHIDFPVQPFSPLPVPPARAASLRLPRAWCREEDFLDPAPMAAASSHERCLQNKTPSGPCSARGRLNVWCVVDCARGGPGGYGYPGSIAVPRGSVLLPSGLARGTTRL